MVLLILIVGSVGLDNAIYSVNSARHAISRDELGQVPINVRLTGSHSFRVTLDLLVEKVDRDTKLVCHASHAYHSVALQQLLIGS